MQMGQQTICGRLSDIRAADESVQPVIPRRNAPVNRDRSDRGSLRGWIWRLSCRCLALQRCGEFCDLLPHDLAGLEFHGRPGRNDEAAPRLIRVATDARFGQFDLQDAEVAKFHCVSMSQCICDVIQSFLNHIEDLVLDQACLVAKCFHPLETLIRPEMPLFGRFFARRRVSGRHLRRCFKVHFGEFPQRFRTMGGDQPPRGLLDHRRDSPGQRFI